MADKKKTPAKKAPAKKPAAKKAPTKKAVNKRVASKIQNQVQTTVFGGRPEAINTKPMPKSSLQEAKGKPAVFSFGRMNPPTVGHQKLVDAVTKEARKQRADAHVFLSHSNDKKKNPLGYDKKIAYAKKAFGRPIRESKSKNVIAIMQELESDGYTDVTMIVGSDRIKEFQDLLIKYNGSEYNFARIQVLSAGDRDPDASDVSGMSASKMRDFAAGSNLNMFTRGLPRKLHRDARKIMDDVRAGMDLVHDLSEEISQRQIDDLERFADNLLRKYNVDIEFTRHFVDRINDERNTPEIKIAEMQRFFKKIQKNKATYITSMEDVEVVLKDMASMLNLPAVVDKKPNGDWEVTMKTIMRKKNFKSTSPAVVYEAIESRRTVGGGMQLRKNGTQNRADFQNSKPADERVSASMRPDEQEKLAQGKAMGRVAMDIYKERGMTRDPQTMSADERAVEGQLANKHMAKFEKYKDEEKRALKTKDTSRRTSVKEELLDIVEAANQGTTNLKISQAKSGGGVLTKDAIRGMEQEATALYQTGKATDRAKAQKITANIASHRRSVGVQGTAHKNVQEDVQQIDEVAFVPVIYGLALLLSVPAAAVMTDLNSDMVVKEVIENHPNNYKMHERMRAAMKEFAKEHDDIIKAAILFAAAGLSILAIKFIVRRGINYIRALFRNERAVDAAVKQSAKVNGLQESYEIGTDEYRDHTLGITPGQEIEEDKGPAQDKYHAGMSDSTKAKRIAHFKAGKEGDAPGDKKAREEGMPESEHTKKFKQMFGESVRLHENKTLKDKASKGDAPYGVVKSVYEKGVAAWKTGGHRPGTTPEQWGYARVNSFLTGGKTQKTADKQEWKEVLKWREEQKKKKKLNEDVIMEAEYDGKKVKLNDPIRNRSGNKKFRVYTTDPKSGKVIKVQFGDPNMSIKRDSDERRKAFRDRHGCDALTFEDDRASPKYWSCRMWEKGKTVSDLD